MHVDVSRMSCQMTSSTQRKTAKRGRKLKSGGPSIFVGYAIVLLLFCGEDILKVLHSMALVNYNEHDRIV